MVYSSQDVHKHSIVGLLVEACLSGLVIFIKYLMDKLKDLCHKFSFVEAEGL
jgi:hypothetical protein